MKLFRLLPVLFLSLAACGAQPPPPPPVAVTKAAPSRITYENYRQIQNGMTEDQVRAVLGDPSQIVASDTVSDSSLILRWKCGDQNTPIDSRPAVAVYFKKGKVVSKEATLVK